MTESTNESDDSRKLNDSEQSTDSVNNHNDQATDAENEQAVPTYKRHAEKADKSAMIKKALLALLVLIVLGVIAYGLYKSNQHSEPEVVTLQGQMQMQQTSIAAKVPGRIAKILVTEGDAVTVGQQLIEMDSPEINAKINQALAGKQMAQSQLDKAENGARPQEIAQAKAAWQANKAASDLAENTYQRVNRLYEEGLMARQKRDEAYAQYLATQDQTEAARLQYDLAKEGARSEDKSAATAQVAQVDAQLEEALVAKEEANLKSPIAGIVDNVIVSAGEVIGQGVPILTLVNTDEQWVVLNVTESYLNQFAIGQQFTGTIPALSSANKPYTKQFTVYATSTLSDFATWRPTNNDDGFDVRTFEVKARPTTPDARIRSGMSVIVRVNPALTNASQE
ncbi:MULTISPECIES: HlyD family secretion protein [Psychrobacter]|uniref:HlyD family secretion protein n=1 Tax=Psychrobacter TaxID=497 RepID=UPI000EB8F628|nr:MULTISPECIES: efflux RND transporter periplasmic adaptor subunit [Psychrobacter]MBE8608482.1 efflux RND transporter periplasmic adaptor subunit [Pseudomonas lundensis]MCG3808556.1 efflux RND transporter periplasmic adaptor subunit [Psychrobacter sp. Ps4]MDN5560518.1 efflux RND transporter periplasmic adaptor subunit [Psychrobacter sp.]HCI75347.1 secretion protein HlyD [Psychrobacter sp.]